MVSGRWVTAGPQRWCAPRPGPCGGVRPRVSRRTRGASGSRAARERDRRALSRAGRRSLRKSWARAAARLRRTPRRPRRRPARMTHALKASSSAVVSYQTIRSPRPRATAPDGAPLRLPGRDVEEEVPHRPGGLGPWSPERVCGNAAEECQGLGPRAGHPSDGTPPPGRERGRARARRASRGHLTRSYAALRPRSIRQAVPKARGQAPVHGAPTGSYEWRSLVTTPARRWRAPTSDAVAWQAGRTLASELGAGASWVTRNVGSGPRTSTRPSF
jgi:hypothetical protein